MSATPPGPHQSAELAIQPEWIDANAHMNVAFYVLVFDRGTDIFLDDLGMGQPYRESHGCATFALEAHITYENEVVLGERVQVTTQLIEWDPKRFVFYQEMRSLDSGRLAATISQLSVHMDLQARRSVPFPPEIRARIEALGEEHRQLPVPSRLERRIRMDNRRP